MGWFARRLSNFRRKLHFVRYNLSPFRPSLIWSHTYSRVKSACGLSRGFRIIDLALTYKCNQLCQHCSAESLKQQQSPLTLEDYRSIVTQAKALDVLSWNITGGEPLLVEWLEDLVAILEPATHFISIQTNCMALTPERARALAKAGVNCVTTSWDSVDPAEHDAFRGVPNAYEKTMAGVRNAKAAGMQVLIGGTVTHRNLRSDNLRKLIERANELGAIFLYNLAIPCGRWTGNQEIILRDGDRDYLESLLTDYPMSTTDHEVGRNAIGCPAGKEKIYVTAYGEVIPCPFIHVSFGNVRKDPLAEIVKRMQQVGYFNRYEKVCIAAEHAQFQETVFKRIQQLNPTGPARFEDVFPRDKTDG